jgi:omega-hydroxy-beta-dihydromenaquinone-9 sulfotransferase
MRRYLHLSIFLVIYGIVRVVNHICLALDEIFYSSYKNVIIKSPLFIISMPRTATTWLQNVIASDHIQITSMKLWEMLFAPSIIQKKFVISLSKADKHFHSLITKQIRMWDSKLFKGYMKVHPSSFFDYEDDDLALVNIFSNLFLIFFFPHLKLFNFLIRFDQSQDEKRKKRILSFYRKCVQKHLFVFGKEKIYLSKSASHIPKIQSLRQWFPDGRFIFTVREPEQVISSTISMTMQFSKVFHTPVNVNSVTERTLKLFDHLFSYPLEVFKTWPESVCYINMYDDLTANIENEVIRIYQHFGIPLSEKFQKLLSDEYQKSKSYKSEHFHPADKCGITADEINGRYRDSFEQYIRFSRFDPQKSPSCT